jgi:two-component system, NarL family, response regulator LiaR
MASRGRPLRLVVADDDPLVRAVLRRELESSGMSVVAEATTYREALALALRHRPDILMLDFVMPGGRTLDLVKAVTAAVGEEVRIVVLTTLEDDEEAIALLRAGASGWLDKNISLNELSRAIAGVVEGEAAVSRKFARVLVDRVRRSPTLARGMRPVRTPLTPREWEVLDLMCDAVEDAHIAEALSLSPVTVRSHVRSIVRKLNAPSRDEAVRWGSRLRATG